MGKICIKANACAHIKTMKHIGTKHVGTQGPLFLESFPVETTWESTLVNQDMNWETIVNGSWTVLNTNKSRNYPYRKEYQ